jgi:hypothetical protein
LAFLRISSRFDSRRALNFLSWTLFMFALPQRFALGALPGHRPPLHASPEHGPVRPVRTDVLAGRGFSVTEGAEG